MPMSEAQFFPGHGSQLTTSSLSSHLFRLASALSSLCMCVGLGARLGSSGSDSESTREISASVRGYLHSKDGIDILFRTHINPFAITCQWSRYIGLFVVTIRRQRQQVRRKFGHVSCLVEMTCQQCRWGLMRPNETRSYIFSLQGAFESLSPSLQERDVILHTCLIKACCTRTSLNLQP